MIEARKYDRRQAAVASARIERKLAEQEIDEALQQPAPYTNPGMALRLRMLRGLAR